MTINKTHPVTISFRENGFEVQHHQTNPNYRKQVYDKVTGEYTEPYDATAHNPLFTKRFVFGEHDAMLAHVKSLTTL